MNRGYVILGSNVGDRLFYLTEAKELIAEQAGVIIRESDVFKTAAWGNTEQDDFYNQALCIETQLSAHRLLHTLLSIEQSLGRERGEGKWMPRTIDIDILFYNREVIDTSDLQIPHPYLQERKFVLAPLQQIATDFIHPVLKKSVNELLAECVDMLPTTKLLIDERKADAI